LKEYGSALRKETKTAENRDSQAQEETAEKQTQEQVAGA